MKRAPRSRILPIALLWLIATASAAPPAAAHQPPDPGELDQAQQNGDLEARRRFARQLENERLSPALGQRAALKIRRAALQARGLSPQEISQELYGGRAQAFPYTASPELPVSGPAKTLTILIDFKDMRANQVLPGLTPDKFADNIYGAGTQEAKNFAPFESVNAYYKRASEGKVDIQGSVLGWHHLPKNRSTYAPKDPSATAQNRAIFQMAIEALAAFDANHDFSQYDHDHDGDIDQLTIIYTGPHTGWGSFFWAYKWNFFVPEAATTTFDGKRLNQFVFQFANSRGPNNDDFNPRTLIHEIGHSFGLADYYDYDEDAGPSGGLGGMDMMDANVGNHNAFSRWLLDWISPEIIGSAAPANKSLVASASDRQGTKAIAVFPGLVNAAAPTREMFIVENRKRTGNDAGLPGEGLLIWHVDPRPNTRNDGFLLDNSFTTPKLIRLVRADKDNDFANNEPGGAGTFFQPPAAFTPASSPGSRDNDGRPTGVSIANLSPLAETVTLDVGIIPSTPGPASAPPQIGQAADEPTTPAAIGQAIERITQQPTATAAAPAATAAAPVAPAAAQASPSATPAPEAPTVADQVDQLAEMLVTATPAAIQEAWKAQAANLAPTAASPPDGPVAAPPTPGEPPRAVVSQLILTSLAMKDGPAAVQAVLELPEGPQRAQTFMSVMEAWAHNNPYEAANWYLAPEQASIRASKVLAAGPRFTYQITRWAAANNLDAAIESLRKLDHPTEVWGAVDALKATADLTSLPKEELFKRLAAQEKHRETLNIIRDAQELFKTLDNSKIDPAAKADIGRLIGSQLKAE